jgi:hypothetical protein
MTTFHVGQRVRIRWCEVPELIGGEAIIEAIEAWAAFDPPVLEGRVRVGEAAYVLRPDLWRSSTSPISGHRFALRAQHIEPILYDGNKVVEWSECLWRPEGVSA